MIEPGGKRNRRSMTALIISWVPLMLIGVFMANEEMGVWYIPVVGACLAPLPIWVIHRIKTRNLEIMGMKAESFHEGDIGLVGLKVRNGNRDLIHNVDVSVQVNDKVKSNISYDLPGKTTSQLLVAIAPNSLKRGRHRLNRACLHVGFPFNLFTTYHEAQFDHSVVVYPKVEPNAPPWPIDAQNRKKARMGEDIVGMRDYQNGDSMRTIDWKLSARQSNLVVREYETQETHSLAFTWEQVAHLGVEPGLQRLTAWVLRAEKLGKPYSLELDGNKLGTAIGRKHAEACLTMMALFRGGSGGAQ